MSIMAGTAKDHNRGGSEVEMLRHQTKAAQQELQHFVYSVSHDLQAPLRALVNFSHLLKRDYSGKMDDRAQHYLHFIIDGGEKAQAMLDGLLQYSRLSTQMKPLEPVDSGVTVGTVLQEMREVIERKQAKVTVETLPAVLADEKQLKILLSALIGNALLYHPPEEVPVLSIRAQKKGDKQEFCVQDHGIGIAPEFHARIFELFKRLHLDSEYPGVGMGLTLAHKIVERHGGEIRVFSEGAKGVSFYFTLPGVHTD